MRIAFIAEGNAETRDCWSGCAQGFVMALRRQGATVDTFNAELRGVARLSVAAATLAPDRRRWRAGFLFGRAGFQARSRVAARALVRAPDGYDALIQAGATFRLPARLMPGVPRIVYADANIRFALRGRPYSGASALSRRLVEAVAARERGVYDAADRLWPWSAALQRSFVEDFEQPPGKCVVIYAGANTVPAEPHGRNRDPGPPRVLFVGKDYRRKGALQLLEAFELVRQELPEAELHLVGADFPEAHRPGVVVHGFLSPSTPAGAAAVRRLYETATVFCMPSYYEAFGVVFIEAMLAGLPCIGSRHWAMPEIIEEGVTGSLVPPGQVPALAGALLQLLRDPTRAAAMGAAGRERALRLFTWDRVAARALADLRAWAPKRAPHPTTSRA